MIEGSIKYLRKRDRQVFFDAEHFFDGYKRNSKYALKTLNVAVESGAKRIILCDTNGGTLPSEIKEIFKEVKKEIKAPLGIHTHNDSGLAIANALSAVEEGAIQIQGTMNGFGERCGNADLIQLIPILQLKLGLPFIPEKKLKELTFLSRYIYEVANIIPPDNQPFVGRSAFAHKGGIHADAVRKISTSYEHINPEDVGNSRRILVSELAGKSTILYKLERYGLQEKKRDVKEILKILESLEEEGYQFEAAEGSLELLLHRSLLEKKKFFKLLGFRVIVEKKGKRVVSEATVKIKVGNQEEHTAGEGDGPVDAMDNALRKALLNFYPNLSSVHLSDYKVRVLNPEGGTAAKVRVLIESQDEEKSWGTVGLSENIIEASLQALLDSLEYKLLKDSHQ